MPHVVLEYSNDLAPLPDTRSLFGDVHAVLEAVAGVQLANSKSRAHGVDAYVGDGDDANAFVHLDVRLMEGRSDATKAEISRRCLAILMEAFADAEVGRNLQITISVSDLERATYAKHPAGTIPHIPSG